MNIDEYKRRAMKALRTRTPRTGGYVPTSCLSNDALEEVAEALLGASEDGRLTEFDREVMTVKEFKEMHE